MRVSFDFDGVLSRPAWQVVAAMYLHEGDTVFVLSARCPEQAARVFDVADQLEIPREQVLLTCNRPKWEAIDGNGIELHFDNNEDELAQIDELTQALTVNAEKIDAAKYVADGIIEDSDLQD